MSLGKESVKVRDSVRYHQARGGIVSDILIRDVPDEVVAAIDARAARLGLSRTQYLRRRLAQDAGADTVPVTSDDLRSFADTFSALADDGVMSPAWQ